MSQISDQINGWADEVNAISTSAMLAAFEARVMAYVNSVKDSIEAKLATYTANNSIHPVDASTTIAWAAAQYAYALTVIAEVTQEVTDLTTAITNLSTAISNKASELASLGL